jgi:hypothetical protein
MKQRLRALLFVFGLLGVSPWSLAQLSAAPTEQELLQKGAKEMLGEELRALLNNQTVYHNNLATGQTFPMYFREDGRRFVKVGNNVRTTKWWMKDGRRCEESIGRPRDVCQKHFIDEGVLRVCADGENACNWVLNATPGDAEGIGK